MGKLAELLDQKRDLEAKKQQIVAFLYQSGSELLDVDPAAAITSETIDTFADATTTRIHELEARRETAFREARDRRGGDGGEVLGALSTRAAGLVNTIAALDRAMEESESRIAELTEHESLLSTEIRRLKRSRVAGELLADLRVTNCPACDQSVEQRTVADGACYVCGQPVDAPSAIGPATRRVDFEMEQIESERAELAELIVSLRRHTQTQRADRAKASSELREVTDTLATLSKPNTAVLHADVSAIDIEIGRLQERIVSVERLRQIVARRDELSRQIDELSRAASDLDAAIARRRTSLALEQASDVFSDTMMDYLNALNRGRTERWTQGPVGLELRPRGFSLTVAGSRWQRRLGGSLTLYFLLAYHFALLRLSGQEGRHYPGFAVLDFPATLEDGANVKDKENYVLEPFAASIKRGRLRGCQLIAAGAAFENLKDAHRIELRTVWRPSRRR